MLKDNCLINLDKKDFDLFFNIIKNSFPDNERRSYLGQKSLLNKEKYNPLVLKVEDKIMAIMATWDFEEFIFIEHLAVDSNLKGHGIGSKLLIEYLNNCKKKIFLEVEPPECEVSKRRIRFYKRLNFNFNEFPYLQQPLNPGDEPIELKIMSYPDKISKEEFDKYKKDIYREVYNVYI